jgi:predicted lipid-binding transport protein (Tim44 family)
MKRFWLHRRAILGAAFALFFLVWLGLDSEVFARAGGGRSSGSRSYSSGGSTSRSTSPTQPSPSQQKQYQQTQPAQPAAPASPSRGFFSGLMGGMVGGLLGGMLFRSLGFAGDGMGGGFGLSDIFLIMIVLGIIYFVVKRFRSRQAMQMSMAGAGGSPYSYPGPGPSPGPILGPPPVEENYKGSPSVDALRHIMSMDPSFNEKAFKDLAEDLFFKIQGGWTRRDLGGIRSLLSPAMYGVFKEQLDRLVADKEINRLENIAVREVEIAGAGQERGEEFVTVRFYANLLDYTVHEKTGQIVTGSSSDPVKFVEYWTFSRNVGEKNWVLGGITQEEGR